MTHLAVAVEGTAWGSSALAKMGTVACTFVGTAGSETAGLEVAAAVELVGAAASVQISVRPSVAAVAAAATETETVPIVALEVQTTEVVQSAAMTAIQVAANTRVVVVSGAFGLLVLEDGLSQEPLDSALRHESHR